MAFIAQIRKWGEFVRFSHTVFALPFALAAMVVAARATMLMTSSICCWEQSTGQWNFIRYAVPPSGLTYVTS